MSEVKKIIFEGIEFTDKELEIAKNVHSAKKDFNCIVEETGRTPEECMKILFYHISSNINKFNTWTPEEDILLVERHKILGDKWTEISKLLPYKNPVDVKNRWNTKFKLQDNEKIQTIQVNQQLKAENDNLTKANSSITKADNSVTKANDSVDVNFFNSESSDYDPFASPFYF